MPWPDTPAIADTMSADSAYTLLYAKLFYRTSAGKEIWLSQYETDTALGSQIAWSASGRPGDNLTAIGNHSTLTTLSGSVFIRVTAGWNLLSYSINIVRIIPIQLHLVIEASSTIQSLYTDDPLARLVIPATDTSASVYAIIRDRFGNFAGYSTATQWISTDTSVVIVRPGDSTTGQGIAIRRANFGQAFLIAVDTSSSPGDTLRDTVPVELMSIYYCAVRIYTVAPAYSPDIDTIRIPTNDSLTLYAEGQRSDDTSRWEPVTISWGKEASLITMADPPTSPAYSWTIVPNVVSAGRIRVTGSYPFLADSVWAVFYDPSSVRDNLDKRLRLESWKVFSDNGRLRIRLPSLDAYNIKIYSLAGHLIDSRATSTVEESFRLPTGVYIVSVGQAGSRQEIRKRVVAIGR
jgi:hypothetical protein